MSKREEFQEFLKNSYRGNPDTARMQVQIHKDFEHYLLFTGLKKDRHEREEWIYRLKDKLYEADERDREANANLTEDDVLWWGCLVDLQDHYGFETDLFGTYQECEYRTNKSLGQHFTPNSIGQLLNELVRNDDMYKEKKHVTFSDPTAGTGRLMIQKAWGFKNNISPRYQDPCKVFYFNIDLDPRCLVFMTLNAALRNLFTLCVHGDCLSLKTHDYFFTIPMMAYGENVPHAQWKRKGMYEWFKSYYPAARETFTESDMAFDEVEVQVMEQAN
jgi:hypothetical protein